ncbi:hypothetical protein ACU686_36060 [Yinghuangia aomiensis]
MPTTFTVGSIPENTKRQGLEFMGTPSLKTAGRVAAAVGGVAALGMALAGCGGSGSPDTVASGSAAAEPRAGAAMDAAPQDGSAANPPSTAETKIAEIKGANGAVLVVNRVQRDPGGFVTVQGVLRNDGSGPINPAAWSGNETVIVNRNLNSVGGATLVDKAGGKRYYILRDTDGQCLCTNGLTAVYPNRPVPVFMQFPAPPATTTEVDFTLPAFATATIPITG